MSLYWHAVHQCQYNAGMAEVSWDAGKKRHSGTHYCRFQRNLLDFTTDLYGESLLQMKGREEAVNGLQHLGLPPFCTTGAAQLP